MGQLYEIGTQLYVQEDGKAGGPAVVFIHGITLDIRVWSAR
jgi:pimeloyl-ACP methyl ester carboxylesterase